jgi:hypothetical protein
MRNPLVALAVLVLLCVPTAAQVLLARTTKAAHGVFIEGYARTDNECESIEPPTVYVDKPPRHGIVCFRKADLRLRTTVENNLMHCLGRSAHGIHVIYMPRQGYAGPDTVRYTVHFPKTQHAVDVILTVLPDDQQPSNAAPSAGGPVIGDVSQTPGPLPVCAALVS